MVVLIDKNEKNEEGLGNKGKFLLQMKKEGFEVPGGFILDSEVYDEVISSDSISDKIKEALDGLRSNDSKVADVSREITALFDGAKIPDKTRNEIERLADKNKLYAVRSSGSKEDLAEYSFAGQYKTFLNVEKGYFSKSN